MFISDTGSMTSFWINCQDITGILLFTCHYDMSTKDVINIALTKQLLWGPLSFVVAAMIVSQHPLRHPLQLIVSLGQLYGDILYFGTSFFDLHVLNLSYWRPEPAYFWGYFFFLNAIWLVIPSSK